MALKEALEKMIAGEGLYMKFNRELTKNEVVFETAIERATDVLRAQGGQTIKDAITDSIKVAISVSLTISIYNFNLHNTIFRRVGYFPDCRRHHEHTHPQRHVCQLVLPNRRHEELEDLQPQALDIPADHKLPKCHRLRIQLRHFFQGWS